MNIEYRGNVFEREEEIKNKKYNNTYHMAMECSHNEALTETQWKILYKV